MYLLGGLLVALMMLVAAIPVAILTGIVIAFTMVRKLLAKKEATNETVEENAVEEEVKTQSGQRKKFRKHVDIGDAAVDLWFHPEEGVVKRVVRFHNKKLAEEHGEKLKLPEIDLIDIGAADALVAQTVDEIRSKFSIGHAAKVAQPAGKRAAAIPQAKASASYTGKIIRFGMETHDGNGGKKFEAFTLHLFDAQAGAPHELRGADLQRAIKEVGARPGDMVKVDSLGRTPVSLGEGKTGFKNLWSVVKV